MNRAPLTPDQEAARWLARDDLDQSPGREAFTAWLEADPRHAEAWARASRVWDVFDDAEENDLIAALARAARQVEPEAARPFARRPMAWRLIAASAAALVVSAALMFGLGRLVRPGPPTQVAAVAGPSLQAYGADDYVTGAGQTSTVVLPDGSRVTLDGDSALDLAFADGRRDLRLVRGHAYFDVAHDPEHRFTVEAGGRRVTALGTQFDVRLEPGGMRVVLAEGRVSVASAGGEGSSPTVMLSPGEAFSAEGAGAGQVRPVDVDKALEWKQGVVEFRDQPLSEAITLLNRETRAQIVIRDPKVAALRITGVFRTGDVRRFGRAVAQVLPVRLIARDADTFELVATGR